MKKLVPCFAFVLLAMLTHADDRDGFFESLFDRIDDHAQNLASTIYDVASFGKIPANYVITLIAQSKIKDMVKDLPLKKDVERRVLERIEQIEYSSATGADIPDEELVPFLMFAKDIYMANDDQKERNFDNYFRKHFSETNSPPGTEHDMFQWAPEASSEEGGAGPKLSDEIIAKFVELYDMMYLMGHSKKQNLKKRLRCSNKRSDLEIQDLIENGARQIIRDVLTEVRDSIEGGSEIREALSGILEDDAKGGDRVRAITDAIINFVDIQACKHYRFFAVIANKEIQLEKWMKREFKDSRKKSGNKGKKLETYLSTMNGKRRFGVQVVVDGLQGTLMEALASGGAHSFLKTVLKEHEERGKFAPKSQPFRKVTDVKKGFDGENVEFLKHISEKSYLHPHYLPFFTNLYHDSSEQEKDPYRPAGVAKIGVSTTPTISVRNLPIAKTGAPVALPPNPKATDGATGIPNFHFVNREFVKDGVVTGRPYYFFGNDALLLTKIARDSGMKSMFERLNDLSTMNCTAQYDELAHFSIDPFLNLAIGEKARDFGDILCLQELEIRASNEIKLKKKREELIEKLKDYRGTWKIEWFDRATYKSRAMTLITEIARLEARGMPDYLLYYNPWPDHFAHFTGPFSDEILAPSGELNRLDYWLRRIDEEYKRAGVHDQTLFGMAGDHGLSPVYYLINPEIEVFGEDGSKDGDHFIVKKISSDEGEGPKMTYRLNPPSVRDLDVVVASTAGGNYMMDFFKSHSHNYGSDDWRTQPIYRDLVKLRTLEGKAIDIPSRIIEHLSQSLDYMLIREKKCTTEESAIRVVGPRNEVRYDEFVYHKKVAEKIGAEKLTEVYFYEQSEGDLLDLNTLSRYRELTGSDRVTYRFLYKRCMKEAKKDQPHTWCSAYHWRILTSLTNRPDSVVQIAHIYDNSLAGTVNLFPKDGIGYNSRVPGRHAGEHFHEKDAFVGWWGTPVKRKQSMDRLISVVNGSLPVVIHEYLRAKPTTKGENGWGYRSYSYDLLK